jgi:cyclic pyranopterin phosphate synthase
MIDISQKDVIERSAIASGKIVLKKKTIDRIKNKEIEKGDLFTIAKTSALTAIKKVPEIIPFCHPIPINHVDIEFTYEDQNAIKVKCTVKSFARTGVEMEALTGVSAALLNLWDVVKRYEKDAMGQYPHTLITDIKVEKKIKKDLSVY